jgi:hypothetical protein
MFDIILGVYVAVTKSESWVATYNQKGTMSILTQFEITNREAPTGTKGQWVTGSKMNATALSLIGHVIIEISPPNSYLGKLKAKKGTIFSPVLGESEYARITNEAAKEVTREEQNIVNSISRDFSTIIAAVNEIFGGSSISIDEALQVARAYAPAEF